MPQRVDMGTYVLYYILRWSYRASIRQGAESCVLVRLTEKECRSTSQMTMNRGRLSSA